MDFPLKASSFCSVFLEKLLYNAFHALIKIYLSRLRAYGGKDKRRNVVERFFNRLKEFRRAETRYDKRDGPFLAFVMVTASVSLSAFCTSKRCFQIHPNRFPSCLQTLLAGIHIQPTFCRRALSNKDTKSRRPAAGIFPFSRFRRRLSGKTKGPAAHLLQAANPFGCWNIFE